MAERIRFCPTPAGRIAFTVSGDGPPVLLDSGWISNLEATSRWPAFRHFIGRLATNRTVIRYDKSSNGLSDASATPISFGAQLAVVEALIDYLALDGVALFGASQGVPVLAASAARKPDRVAALVLYAGYACGGQLANPAVQESLVALIQAHWGIGSRTMADVFMADADADELHWFAEYQRKAATADVAGAMLYACFSTDVRDSLPSILAPTLVIHRRQDQAVQFELGRDLAGRIPGAEMVTLEGRSHFPWVGDTEAVLEAATRFLDRYQPTSKPADLRPDPLSRREREVAILVARGLTNAEVATRLSIAPRTADAHLEHIRLKLNVRSRAEIAAWSTARGLGVR